MYYIMHHEIYTLLICYSTVETPLSQSYHLLQRPFMQAIILLAVQAIYLTSVIEGTKTNDLPSVLPVKTDCSIQYTKKNMQAVCALSFNCMLIELIHSIQEEATAEEFK